MNVEDFYSRLDLPDSSLLDKRIFKRMVIDHGQLTPADKKTLSEDIKGVKWKYTLKASTVQVLPYEDPEREYLEVAVVEAVLNRRRKTPRIAEMLQRAIPYPVLLVLVEGLGVCISVAHKRFNLAEKGSIVADGFLRTTWIDEPTEVDEAFFEALALTNLPQVDFHALYGGMVSAVLTRCASEVTEAWTPGVGVSESVRRARLDEYHAVQREMESLRKALRVEHRFAEKVELNTRIKDLEARLERTRASL